MTPDHAVSLAQAAAMDHAHNEGTDPNHDEKSNDGDRDDGFQLVPISHEATLSGENLADGASTVAYVKNDTSTINEDLEMVEASSNVLQQLLSTSRQVRSPLESTVSQLQMVGETQMINMPKSQRHPEKNQTMQQTAV